MEYNCFKCTKKYASYKSLWFHNYKYHKKASTENTPLPPTHPPEKHQNTPKNKCDFCNIIFSRKDSLTRHINKNRCKNDNKKSNEVNMVKIRTKILMQE